MFICWFVLGLFFKFSSQNLRFRGLQEGPGGHWDRFLQFWFKSDHGKLEQIQYSVCYDYFNYPRIMLSARRGRRPMRCLLRWPKRTHERMRLVRSRYRNHHEQDAQRQIAVKSLKENNSKKTSKLRYLL